MIAFLTSLIDNILFMPGGVLGFLEDFGVITFPIGMFFIIVLTGKIPQKFIKVFKGKHDEFEYNNGVLKSIQFNDNYTKEIYEKDFESCFHLITAKNKNGKALLYLLYGLGIFSNLAVQVDLWISGVTLSWSMQTEYISTYIAQELWNILLYWFVLPESVFIILTSAYSIVKLTSNFSKRAIVILSPVSSKSSGGLNELSELCLFYVKILFFPFLFFFPWIIQLGFTAEVIVAIPFYILMLSLVFFVPLVKIHQSMDRFKGQELEKIENLYKQNFLDYKNKVNSEYSKKELIDYSEALIKINDVFMIVKKQPVWPYDFGILRKFFSIILIPVILFIFQLADNYKNVIELLKGILSFFGFYL
jgi:hypothetical protein